MTPEAPRPLRSLLFLLFALSGFSGLIYESVWSHYMKLVLGHAAYAQTLVLTIFMGGMALGAWLAGRHAVRGRNLLLAYAAVEALIGICGLLFDPAFRGVTGSLFGDWLSFASSPAAVTTTKWFIAGGLILPQSVMLGATFPLMSVGIIRLFPRDAGATLGMLYFTNSIGAAVGVLVSAFYLIPTAGLPGTILFAASINLLLSLAVWTLTRERAVAAPRRDSPARVRDPLVATLLLASLVTGMASFCYEIGWIRMLSLVLGSTTQAFEMMLSAFITGLALGGLWIRRRIDRLAAPIRFSGHVQILMGLLALLTLVLYNASFDLMAWLMGHVERNEAGYLRFNLASHALAMAIMLPPTFMAGMTLPLYTHVLLRRGRGEASVGRVYAANTFGAIVGVLLAIHLIMPAIGTKGLIMLGASFDLLLGIGLLWLDRPATRRFEIAASVALSVAAVALVSLAFEHDVRRMASGVYRHGNAQILDASEVIFHTDGKTASISVVRGAQGELTITTNGKPEAMFLPGVPDSSVDAHTMALLGLLPVVMRPDAKRVATIGLGCGLTTHTVLGSPAIERVDTVEIERAMLDGARSYGKAVGRVFDDPRSHIHIDDAKAFFSANRVRYDVIISEPSNPWVSGVASLFSTEFYADIQRYMKPDGLFVQWVQTYETDFDILASIFKTLGPQFRDYSVFAGDNDLLILATNGPKIGEIDAAQFARSSHSDGRAHAALRTPADLAARRMGGKALLDPLFQTSDAPLNSDYFPYIAHAAPRARFLTNRSLEVPGLAFAPLPISELLEGRDNPRRARLTHSPHIALTRLNAVARSVRGRFRAEAGWHQDASDGLRAATEALLGCAQRPLTATQAATALHDVAQATMPFLPRPDLVTIWNDERLTRCTARSAAGAWLTLHRAVASASPVGMAAAAEQALQQPPPGPGALHYALGAALLGHLKSDNRARARALVSRFATALPAGPGYLRLIVAHVLLP